MLTLRPLLDRETLLDPDEDLDFETLPEDLDDRDDRETSPDERDDDLEDDREASPEDLLEELDRPDSYERDEPDLLDRPDSYDREDPDLLDRPDEASPLLRVDRSTDGAGVGYHSTPLRVREDDLDVARELRPESSDDRVVARDRVVERVVPDRSSVRPPSLYLFLVIVAVLVLTRVAFRVVIPSAERVVVRDPDVVPLDRPIELLPTRTPRSVVSPFRIVDLVRS